MLNEYNKQYTLEIIIKKSKKKFPIKNLKSIRPMKKKAKPYCLYIVINNAEYYSTKENASPDALKDY